MKFMKKIAAMAAATAVAAVSLVSMGSMGASATDEPPYTAYLCISAGGDAQWKAGDWETESATITGDGVYSTSVTIPEDKGSETIEFLMLFSDINAYAFAPEGTSNPVADGTAKITINSIKVVRVGSGEEAAIAYNGPSEHSMFLNDDGRTLRVNILNTWATAQNTTDIDPNVPGGLAAGDKVVVDFAVSGINAGGGTATTDPASTTEAPKNTDPNGTTADPSKTTAAGETTTTAAGGSNGGNNSSNGGSSNGGSSNGSSSGSSNGSTNNATTSQTGDFGIAAVVLGAVATAALGAGAYTITRKKK